MTGSLTHPEVEDERGKVKVYDPRSLKKMSCRFSESGFIAFGSEGFFQEFLVSSRTFIRMSSVKTKSLRDCSVCHTLAPNEKRKE